MSTSLAQPPAPLATAIQNASHTYGVPVDVLTGIWRVESGSSYPNPYVNSSGYGGLFGTTDWNGPTQEQANLSASILANLVKTNNGDLGKALSAYSGGGYTSVPGEASHGGGNSILSDVEKAAGTGVNILTGGAAGALGAPSFGIPNPISAIGNSIGGTVGKEFAGIATWIEGAATRSLLYVVFTAGAFALILLGLNRASGGAIGRTARSATIAGALA